MSRNPQNPMGARGFGGTTHSRRLSPEFDLLHTQHPDVLIQINHAFEMGLFGAADWRR